MDHKNKEAYSEIKINLKREENGANLLNYLEKAAADLNLYTENQHLNGVMCGNPCLNPEDCVNISFFSPISKLLHLYIAKFSITVNKNEIYSSLKIIDEPLVSIKKVKQLSQKLESKMEELLK
jgi:hypothetical protein